jgi:hypothetical protein
MTSTQVLHKRGDTWHKRCTFLDDESHPQSLSGYTIRSQVRTLSGDLVTALTVNITDAINGEFELGPQSANWPISILECDIEYTISGVVFSTETFYIDVRQDVTQ